MTPNQSSRSSLKRFLRRGLFTTAILASAGYSVNAQTLTWDPSATPATGSQASGTWSPSGTGSTVWSNGTTDQTWLDGDIATFGPTGATGSATVTLSGAVSPVELNFTATGYTLTGGSVLFGNGAESINLGTSGLNEEIDSNIGITSVAAQQSDLRGVVATGSTLTLAGGIDASANNAGKALSFGGGGTVILTSVASNTTAYSTTYNVGGALFAGSGAIIQEGNTSLVNGSSSTGAINAALGQPDGVPGGTGSYTVNSAGALFNVFNLNVGQGNTYTLDVENGVAEVGNSFGIGTDNNTSRTTAITDTVKVGGTGQLASNAAITLVSNNGTAQNAVLEIDGGVTVANKGIVVGGSTAAAGTSATVNVTGGKLFVGTGGIATGGGAATTSVNFSGGTIGATADWSSSMNIALTNKTTIQTSDTGASISASGAPTNIYTYTETDTAHNITLSGNLSGTGGLIVTGPGTLSLSGANTYSGDTEVAAGADLDLLSSLGLGASSTLTLDSATNSFVDLNFNGSDTIAGLTIGGVALAAGTYDAAQLGSDFDGTGDLIITSSVPEPTTWVMMLSGLILLVGIRRARSKGC